MKVINLRSPVVGLLFSIFCFVCTIHSLQIQSIDYKYSPDNTNTLLFFLVHENVIVIGDRLRYASLETDLSDQRPNAYKDP